MGRNIENDMKRIDKVALEKTTDNYPRRQLMKYETLERIGRVGD